LSLSTIGPSSRLDILVENSGRINSTGNMRTEIKGITHQVRFGGKPLTGWQVFCLPMSSVNDVRFSSKSSSGAGPGFFHGSFQIDQIGDVFLDVRNLGKGALWINGHAIGRFWNVGPQQTLYVPGPWLHRGKNEIVVFDLFGKQGTTPPHLAGLAKPILDASTKDAKGSKQE
jgi:beta-galactosidase